MGGPGLEWTNQIYTNKIKETALKLVKKIPYSYLWGFKK